MKKHLLALLLTIFSLSLSAQKNWKTIYYQDYIELQSHGNYTWTSDISSIYRINNSTHQVDKYLDSLKVFGSVRGITSRNAEIWFSYWYKGLGFCIRHYKSDGTYYEYIPTKYTSTEIFSYFESYASTCNYDGSKAYFLRSNNNILYYFRDNSVKNITLSDNLYHTIKYIDDNTLLISSSSKTYYELIDTNGVVKKKIGLNTLGIINTNNSIYNFDVDENKNIYFAVKNVGIIKMNCQSNDTVVSGFVSLPTFGNNNFRNFTVKYTADNKILLLNGDYANVYEVNGTLLYSIYNLSIGGYDYYYSKNININSNHELITTYNNSPTKFINNNWIDIFEMKNRYYTIGGFTNATFSNNGYNIIGNNNSISVRIKNNISISVLNEPSQTPLYGSTVDKNGVIWYNKLWKLYELADNDSEIEHIDFPTDFSSAYVPNMNLMNVTNDNKIQYLGSYEICSYNRNSSSWDRYSPANGSNISTLKTFISDTSNNTWVGTNKGMALVNNNTIQLSQDVNENRVVGCVRFLKSKNSLIYTINYNFIEFVVYNLTTKTKTTYSFPSNYSSSYEYTMLSVDKNENVWFTSNNSGVHRFNTQTMSFDLNLNSSNSDLLLNDINLIAVDQENNKIFHNTSKSYCQFYNENEIVLTQIQNTPQINSVINLYPNPSSSTIHINSTENISKYSIFNMLGELIINEKLVNDQIDISALAPGTYVLKLIGDKGESFWRIVKK